MVVPVAVFGTDQRTAVPERYSALEGRIGMIYEPTTQTLCTAFCVAPGIIATAAHCLFQPKNGRLPSLDDVSFRLDYGKVSLSSGIAGRSTPFAKHHIAVGTTLFSEEPPLSAPKDWALVKLARPICRFGALTVTPIPISDVIAAARRRRVFQLAYHWDYNHWQLAYSTPCQVGRDFNRIEWRFIRQHFADADDLLLHDCDTGGASSGSPLLLDTPSGPVAVAINVGTYTRTRILLRHGQVVRRLKPHVIANTAVSTAAFNQVLAALSQADIITDTDQLMTLQTELQARGLYSGAIDGEFGRGTRSAIRAFENLTGLPLTGLPTQALLKRLGEDRTRPAHMLSTQRGATPEAAPWQAKP